MARFRYVDIPEFREKFIAGIKLGMSCSGMAKALCVSDQTISDYFTAARRQLEEDPTADTNEIKLYKGVREAEMKFEQFHLENIRLAAVTGDWKADAWLLERRRQKEYVVRQELAIENKEPVTFVMDVKPTNGSN